MKITEAIILAGGLGTRLKDAVPNLPKCMAPVARRPFLFYVINYLRSQGIEKFIFSLGYKHEVIEAYLDDQFSTLNFQCSIEAEPLGTGGGIKLACEKTTEKNVLVVNGDTLFKINSDKLSAFHNRMKANCTLSLKPMQNFDRYGVVELNEDHSIKNFKEKQFYKSGYINGGVYVLNVPGFLKIPFTARFSFENDYLEKFFKQLNMFGVVQNEYFIDIGIPEDYARAQKELQAHAPDLKKIDKSWTLFLDRDGVINQEKPEEYVKNWDEFNFYDEATAAIKILAEKFGKIIIVTNQRGVAKELLTEDGLTIMHRQMLQEIEKAGGRIDKIYYCTSQDNLHPNRKPNPGMAYEAKRDFQEIDFSKSIIVGNKPSDMLFGRNAGMFTVFVTTTNKDQAFPHADIDLTFPSLVSFAKAL